MAEHRVVFHGSLDLASVPELLSSVDQIPPGRPSVVLDLAGMEFVDSTGVRSLVTLKQRFAAEGRTLTVTGFRPEILDILDILGVRDLICDGNG